MKAALFSNALSLYNRTHAGHVTACAAPLGITEYLIDTPALQDLTQIDAMLTRHADAGGDTLIVNGGDGTLDLLIARLRRAPLAAWQPNILLLRGGTTNMTHRDVGYGKNPAAALAEIMRRSTPWNTTQRDVLCLRGDCLPGPQYGFFFGTHALARAIRHARRTLHRRGITGTMGEAWVLGSTLVALLRGKAHGHPLLDPTALHYTRNGVSCQSSHVLLMATTLNTLMLGLRPARPQAGAFGCVSIHTPMRGLLRELPSLWRGTPNQSEGSLIRWCDRAVTLRLDSEVTLDGELFATTTQTPLTLTIDTPITFLS